ncbi:MAG: hypothetical protein AAFY21_05045 [Cyanobacteria bacterium J06641_2]
MHITLLEFEDVSVDGLVVRGTSFFIRAITPCNKQETDVETL